MPSKLSMLIKFQALRRGQLIKSRIETGLYFFVEANHEIFCPCSGRYAIITYGIRSRFLWSG